MGRIVSFTGPSGAGKTSIARELLKLSPHVSFVESLTTRTARDTDSPGEYRYVSKDTFTSARNAGELLWSVDHAGILYGTSSLEFERILGSPDAIGVMILVPSVLDILRCTIKDYENRTSTTVDWMCCYVIPPPEEILRERMRRRGDPEEWITRRMDAEKDWKATTLSLPTFVHMISNNGTLEHAVSQVTSLLRFSSSK